MDQKRKLSTNESVNSKAWKMMKGMGYEQGKGLGADSQGRTEAVPVEVKKDRRGFGMSKSTAARDSTMPKFDFHNGPHAWNAEMEVPTVDDDHMYVWSRWDDPSYNGMADTMQATTPKGQVPTANAEQAASALESFQHLLLSPNSSEALGEPVTEMRDQTLYCSKRLVHELFDYKDELDSISRDQLLAARMRSNPFEDIRKGIFMNRAAMKMANMDHLLDFLFSRATPQNEVLHFADICAGPGGFSEYLLWRRCNPPLPTVKATKDPAADEKGDAIASNGGKQEVELGRADIKVRGYGMTLISECDFKLNDFLAGPVEAFCPHYGTCRNGDITSWANLNSFANFISKCTNGEGVSVVMADGGFDVSGQQNLQEVLSKRIYLCQCLCALTVLRPGGHFITKMFDVFTEFSADLVRLMSFVFREVAFIKPVTSRPANAERYLLCKRLLSPNSTMAGCPKVPPSVGSSPVPAQKFVKSSTTSANKPKQKMPGSGRQSRAPVPATRSSNQCEQTTASVDTESAVGVLIQHFLDVNEKLRRLESETPNTVLRLCHPEVVMEDRLFSDFLRESNEEMAKKECKYLSKLLAFVENTTLSDDRQKDIKEACLRKWKIPAIPRVLVPWPLWPHNHISLLDEIGANSNSNHLIWLPSFLSRPENVPDFTSLDLTRREFAPDSLVGVVCGGACNSADGGLARPMTIYSRGGMPNGVNIEITYDGKIWMRLDSKFPNLRPRIPAASLLWGIATYEYDEKTHLRKWTLTVLDVACIYGKDLQYLSYRKRMKYVSEVAAIVNFEDGNQSGIIVPPLVALRDLDAFIKGLPVMSCKDRSDPGPMVRTGKNCACIPSTLYLAAHLAAPWIEVKSSKTGQFYYYNRNSNESVYTLPQEAILPYGEAKFFKVPWTRASAEDFDAVQLAQEVLHLDF